MSRACAVAVGACDNFFLAAPVWGTAKRRARGSVTPARGVCASHLRLILESDDRERARMYFDACREPACTLAIANEFERAVGFDIDPPGGKHRHLRVVDVRAPKDARKG